MKKNILFVFCLAFSIIATAQNFTGQWKGIFTDKSSPFGGGQCEYVLELECKGTSVTGSSYTYSSEGGKMYYSICTVSGVIDPKQKYIEVKETARTKTNWPVNVGNCLQVHKLTYFKNGDSSILKGNWVPDAGQGNCGFGTTLLIRRELKQSYPNFNAKALAAASPKKPDTAVAIKKTATTKPANKTKPVLVKKDAPKNTIALKPRASSKKQPATAPAEITKSLLQKETAVAIETPAFKQVPDSILLPKIKFQKRNNTVLETISVNNKTVKVDLYDNGEVDGDSISLFYNGALLLSSKRLSEKPITLTITVEDDTVNELVMYAENLGTIPPNTALMVVTDGAKRYEVRITSDLQKSGVINFVHKAAATGH